MNFWKPMSALRRSERKLSNRVTATVAAVGAALAVTMGAPARANTLDEHENLWNALQNAGVTVVTNSPKWCDDNTDGIYSSYKRLLVVCQDKAHAPYTQVAWTENDLDTLRHEAHHVVQDCLRGSLGDNDFDVLFDNPDELTDFVTRALPEKEIDWIITNYVGVDDEVILQELEAFATARTVNADTIAGAVKRQCSK